MQNWEERLVRTIDERADELLELAGAMIRIPSENPEGDCTEIAEFTANYLREHGLDAQVLDAGDGRVNVLSQRGVHTDDEQHLVLSGHYDVVPVGDTARWSFPPFAGDIVDGYLRGRGASDMKAGLAGALFVYALLAELGAPLKGKLSFLGVCDEEVGGRRGTDWVLENGYLDDATAGIIAEPAERSHPTIGQKGSNWFRMTIEGKPGHGSLQPLHGVSANLLASRAIVALQKLWDMKPNAPEEVRQLIADSKIYAEQREGYQPGVGEVFERVTINVGKISGGTSTNVVADRATVEIDTRVPIGLSRDEVNARVREILAEEGIEAEIEGLGFMSEPNYTPPTDPIVRELIGVLHDIGDPEAQGVLQWASSDARTFRSHGVPVLQYGPAELSTIHGFDEKAPVDHVVLAAKVYALTTLRYLGLTESAGE